MKILLGPNIYTSLAKTDLPTKNQSHKKDIIYLNSANNIKIVLALLIKVLILYI